MSKEKKESKLSALLEFLLDYPDFTLCLSLILSVVIISTTIIITVVILK